MKFKILVTPRSFGNNPSAIKLLQEQGYEVTLNPYGRIMTKGEMTKLIADVHGIIVGIDPLDADVIRHAHKLKAISKYGVGTDNIDLNEAQRRGIYVAITAGANKEAVADYTFALMLGVARKINEIDRACRSSNWNKMTTIDVWGKSLGLIGLGAIGKAVAKRASGFNMKVVAFDLFRDEDYASANGIEYVPLDQLLQQADFVSLHLPLTDETRYLIGCTELEQMKPTAVLVNTARGGLVDEHALYTVLKEGRIWGAGIDVFEQEPPSNPKFVALDNIVIGSHCAASTMDAVEQMGLVSSRNLIQALASVRCTSMPNSANPSR